MKEQGEIVIQTKIDKIVEFYRNGDYMINRAKYLNQLISNKDNGFPKVITGMRRCGKVSDFIKSTQTKYTIHTTLVSANEVIDNSYAGNLQSIITAEDLFVN